MAAVVWAPAPTHSQDHSHSHCLSFPPHAPPLHPHIFLQLQADSSPLLAPLPSLPLSCSVPAGSVHPKHSPSPAPIGMCVVAHCYRLGWGQAQYAWSLLAQSKDKGREERGGKENMFNMLRIVK